MKKKFIYCVIIFLAIVLQTSVLPLLLPGNTGADVVLMMILAGAVLDGFFGFFWWSVFAGLVYDLVSYSPVGMYALIFLMVVYFVSFFSRRFSVELRGIGLVWFMFFVVAASLASHFATRMSFVWGDQGGYDFFELVGPLGSLGLEIFFNMILFFICFATLKKAKNFFAID